MIHSLKARGSFKLKPGTGNSVKIFHGDGKFPSAPAIISCLPEWTLAGCCMGSRRRSPTRHSYRTQTTQQPTYRKYFENKYIINVKTVTMKQKVFKTRCMYFKGTKTQKKEEQKKKNLPPAHSFPKGPQQPGWARLSPAATPADRVLGTGLRFPALTGASAGSWMGSRATGTPAAKWEDTALNTHRTDLAPGHHPEAPYSPPFILTPAVSWLKF